LTTASIERLTVSGAQGKMLASSLSSSVEPSEAVSIFRRSFFRSAILWLLVLRDVFCIPTSNCVFHRHEASDKLALAFGQVTALIHPPCARVCLLNIY